jgi:hypothetical protein
VSVQLGQTTIVLSPRKVARLLLIIMGFLLVGRIATGWWHLAIGHEDRFGLMRQFNTNCEANAPTYFSDLILLLAAVLLALISATKRRRRDRYARQWTALACLLFYLSVDEACQIHEYWGAGLQALGVHLGVFMNYSWVPLGVAAVVGVSAFFLPFVMSLPRRWKRAFIAAAFMYVVCGALGGEVVNAFTEHSRLAYAAGEAFEEFSEMGGVVMLIWALLTYVEAYGICVLVQPRTESHPHVEEPKLLNIGTR